MPSQRGGRSVAEKSTLKSIKEALDILQPIIEEGPEKFVLRRITQFMIGIAVGTAVSIGDTIAWVIEQYQTASVFAARQFGRALLPDGASRIEVYVAELVEYSRELFASLGDTLGPLAIPVILFSMVALVALGIRLLRSTAVEIPIVSGIQTFLEGE